MNLADFSNQPVWMIFAWTAIAVFAVAVLVSSRLSYGLLSKDKKEKGDTQEDPKPENSEDSKRLFKHIQDYLNQQETHSEPKQEEGK
jgi:hypothetical protein